MAKRAMIRAMILCDRLFSTGSEESFDAFVAAGFACVIELHSAATFIKQKPRAMGEVLWKSLGFSSLCWRPLEIKIVHCALLQAARCPS